MSRKEFDRFEQCSDCKYFPQMKPLRVLGAIDDGGQLKEPEYVIGPVTYRGANVMHGNNHPNYVDCRGFCNIARYLQDFKESYPVLYHVIVGQFFPNIKTEMDCELMFSQAGFLYDPRRAITGIRMYDHLVVGKNCLNRIH